MQPPINKNPDPSIVKSNSIISTLEKLVNISQQKSKKWSLFINSSCAHHVKYTYNLLPNAQHLLCKCLVITGDKTKVWLIQHKLQ
jgi:hypothetical protein